MKSRFSRYFRSLTLGLGLVIVAILGWRCALSSRKDPALLHLPVRYAETTDRSVYTSRRKRLLGKVKKGFGIVKVSDLRAGENIVQFLRQGFVLNATTVITAEKSFYFGNRGGGKGSLFNPNELKYCNAFDKRSERPLPKPLSKRRLKGSESSLNGSRRLTPISSASASKAGRYSQSPLLLIETDSPVFIGGGDSFETRNDRLDNSVVSHALKATKENVGLNKKNLFNIQKILGKSELINKTDKAEWAQGIKTVVNNLSGECEEAKTNLKRAQEEKASREYIKEKEEEVKRLEYNLRFERAQLHYHLKHTLNSNKVTLKTNRQPKDTSHGNLAASFQTYNQEKLTEDQNKIIDNELEFYFDGSLNGIRNKTITFAENAQFQRLAESSLESCVDINDTRLKMAISVKVDINDSGLKIANSVEDEDAPKYLIKWVKKQRPCLDKRYKNDPFKSEPNEVDRYLLKRAKLSQIR